MSETMTIRAMSAVEATERIDRLVAIARDSVVGGASINFLADVSDDHLRAFWRRSIAEQELGRRHLFVAEVDGEIAGTTLLILSQNQNSPHRGDVGKMLVHSEFRRRGLGARLLAAVEAAAIEHGRTLLMLDTETGSAGEDLYNACGWICFGVVPDHSLKPDGTPKPTSFFYKIVG